MSKHKIVEARPPIWRRLLYSLTGNPDIILSWFLKEDKDYSILITTTPRKGVWRINYNGDKFIELSEDPTNMHPQVMGRLVMSAMDTTTDE